MSYRHLFVALELDDPNTALVQRADAFAKLSGALLTIATAIPDLRSLYHGLESQVQRKFDESVVDNARERIETLCRKAGITPDQVRVVRGDADRMIAEEAERRKADLLVFGNHDRHGLDQFIGGFGLGLLFRAHCDLLAINLSRKGTQFDSPLVALANDPDDDGLMTKVRALKPVSPSAVHVVRPPWREPWADKKRLDQDKAEIAARVHMQIMENLSSHAPFDLSIEFDKPSQGIQRTANAGHHDLIAMGSGRHSKLGWHLGSTAHNLLSRTQLNVLLVRPMTVK